MGTYEHQVQALFHLTAAPSLSKYKKSCVIKTFIVGGYPMIFHHLKALSNLAEVKNVFLLGGSYDEKKFRPFMDQVRT
jgi:hypothetical protein